MPTRTLTAMKPESLANLKSKLAPDAPGLTAENSKAVSVRLHVDDIAAISKLPGDRSYHIRQAVLTYLKTRDDLRASSLAQAQTQESLPEEYDPVADTILFYEHPGYWH